MNTINVKLMKDDDYCNGRSTLLTMTERTLQALLKESELERVHLDIFGNSMYYYHEKLGLHIHVSSENYKFIVVIYPGFFWL
jgi:hypothetical protein